MTFWPFQFPLEVAAAEQQLVLWVESSERYAMVDYSNADEDYQ